MQKTPTCTGSTRGSQTSTRKRTKPTSTTTRSRPAVRIENRHGLTTQVAYTWSHLLSIVANDLNGLSNPFNARYDFGIGHRLRSSPYLECQLCLRPPVVQEEFERRGALATRRLVNLRHHVHRNRMPSACLQLFRQRQAWPGRRHKQSSRPGRNGHTPEEVRPMVQHLFLCRSFQEGSPDR